MEEDSGRYGNAVEFFRRGSGISIRNQSNGERPSQNTNKAGKATNLNPMKARWAGNKDKPRYLHEPFHSPGYKASSASSSKAPVRKYYDEKQKRPFLAEADNAESSNRRAEIRRLQSGKKTVVYEDEHLYTQHAGTEGSSSATAAEGGLPKEPDLEVLETSVSSGISAHTVDSTVRNTAFSTSPRRQKDKEESSSRRSQGAYTFVRQTTAPRTSTFGVKSSSSSGPGVQRHGLKNLGCTSISDVLPSGCSSSDSVYNRRFQVSKKRTCDADSSSRTREISRQASFGQPPAIYPGIAGPRARAVEQSTYQQTARTCGRSIQESTDSVRTRRPPSIQRSRERVPGEREDGVFALRETVTSARHPERDHFFTDDVPSQRSARPFYAELPHVIYSSNRQEGSVSRTARRRSSPRPEGSPPQMLHSLFQEGDAYRRINMEGIAEVLLALDRVEQDDELTYEQLLVLETNLLLSRLGLHDQHHDMRLDIDNMSYEELLALEEKIGSVSTALSEEQFAKYVNRNVYKARNEERELNIAVDEMKCSICQEEYIEDEEIGIMQCDHQYHVCCIHEWLRQKNWCPICKASAILSKVDKDTA